MRRFVHWRMVTQAIFIVLVFSVGVGVGRYDQNAEPVAIAASSFTELEEFAILQATWDVIHDEWVLPGDIDNEALIHGAATGMVDALGDVGHSRFLDPQEADFFQEATQGEYTGIGIEIDMRGDRPTVVAPIDNSPAAEAAVRSGDTILAIDGQQTLRLDRERIGELIRGDAGTSVTLTLLHRGAATPYTVTLTRRTISIEPISWRLLPNDIAQLRITEFSAGTTRDLKTALTVIRDAGANAIILDLRDNPGGLVSEAIGVASQFMAEGTTIFQQQQRGAEPKPINTVGLDGLWLDQPLVVLVNGGSASAAEIVGAALRDNGRARLLGETTYGTGTVLLPFEQEDGSIVLLGTALWLSADGNPLWKVGAEPDSQVALPFDASVSRPNDDPRLTEVELARLEDVQLRSAYAALAAPSLSIEGR